TFGGDVGVGEIQTLQMRQAGETLQCSICHGGLGEIKFLDCGDRGELFDGSVIYTGAIPEAQTLQLRKRTQRFETSRRETRSADTKAAKILQFREFCQAQVSHLNAAC